MAQFVTPALLQIFDSSGNPLASGKCYIYQTGTTTELSLFSDSGLSTPLANPLVADSAGVFPAAYLAETSCKIVVKTSADVTLYTRDPVFPSAVAGSFAADDVTYDGTAAAHAATDVQAAIEETQANVDALLIDPSITGTIKEDIFTITDGAGFEIDPGNGSIQLVTLGANRTPAATNFTAGESVTMMINDGSARTIDWTTVAVTWVGGSAPTLATSGYTVVVLWKVGTTIYGAFVGNVA